MAVGHSVREELVDSFPEELNRTALRDIKFKRPNARHRWQVKRLNVRKFLHLTSQERYDAACFHAAKIERVVRLADCMLVGHLLVLAQSSLHVALSQITRVPCELSHVSTKMQYKQGLFLVRGELEDKSNRTGGNVVKLVPIENDLVQAIRVIVRFDL